MIMEEKDLYPIKYNDKLWFYKDCDELFRDMYYTKEQLNSECGVYLSEDMWIYPDGSMGEW